MTALDNGQHSPRKLLRAVVARLLGRTVPKTLWIGGPPGGRFFPDPSPVFDALRPEAEGLTWVIWGWMDATWNEDSADFDVVHELEERVGSSPLGVPMSWDALTDLLSAAVQVVDGNFVGCSDPSLVPHFPDANLRILHDCCEIVVTAFDSSEWIVSAPPPVIERLEVAFPESYGEAVSDRLHESIFIVARELDRHLGERLFAGVDRGRISRPPNYALEPAPRQLPHPDVVLIEVRPDGIFLSRFTASEESGSGYDEVFRTITDAQQRAALDYEEALGDWHSIPPDEPDALKYALRTLNAKGRRG